MSDDSQARSSSKNEALLKEIRENFRYGMDYWSDSRKERQKDMRYLCGDPWDPEERKVREDPEARRPCISHDELNQYVNQGVNNLRQNKRGIKIEPRGNGANDQTAELRQDLVRTIEYESKAQSAYLRAGQDMFEGSYGFFRITRRFVIDDPQEDDPAAFNQEIVIKPIPNPDSVIYDPNCKEPDWSDASWCFIVEPMSTDDFKRRYPKAERTDFSTEDIRASKGFITDKVVIVAEYWKLEVTSIDFARKGRTRPVEKKKLCQYITNGVEILDESEHPGREIPIPAMVGMERYVDQGSGPKRVLFSLPRLAREPQMSLAYLVSQEMEEAGMSPKVPVMGYVGQFDTDADAWDHLNKIPRSYVQVDPVPDPMNPNQVLPLPQWRQFVPNFQQYEIAKDSCRRAIQAAMGISPLPTAAQRQNEKSGVALDAIQTEQAVGSYHFVEGYNRALERAGRIIDSWIPVVYDTEQDKWLQRPDDSRRLVKLNTDQPYPDPKTGQQQHFPISEDHQHAIGVSTGPSMQSQRDEVSKFLDTLIANLHALPVPPPAASKLLALAIQMKDLGPKGDQMAEIISPTEGDQSQQLQGMQQKMQQQGEILQAMQAELQKLQLERAGKVIEMQGRMALEDKKIEGQVTVAEVNTKAQNLEERMKFIEDLWQQLHSQAHEAGMQAQDHAHQADQAGQDRQAAAVQAQQAQEQQSAGADQGQVS